MTHATLEHANLTVRDAVKTADLLCALFDWTIRWQGPAKNEGYTVHVGNETSYLALYQYDPVGQIGEESYRLIGALNHLGIVVDDLDAAEARVKEAGFKTFSHADYEPGRRFYFRDEDAVEYEVVSYA